MIIACRLTSRQRKQNHECDADVRIDEVPIKRVRFRCRPCPASVSKTLAQVFYVWCAHDSQGGPGVLEGRDLKAFCGLLMNEDQLES